MSYLRAAGLCLLAVGCLALGDSRSDGPRGGQPAAARAEPPDPPPGAFVAEALPLDLQAIVDAAGLPGGGSTETVPPEHKAVVQDDRKLWPVGYTIRVSFLGGTPEARRKVARYAAAWSGHANLKFDFGGGDGRLYRPGDGSPVRISFSRPGYYSMIGTDCLLVGPPQETMNLHHFDINPPAEDLFRAIVIHEFGHAIGLSHEHQGPNANCGWNWPVVYRELAGPPNNWDRATIDRNMRQLSYHANPRLTATKHDPKSVMHYAFPARYFLDPASPCRVRQNTDLSETDVAAARALYPADGERGGERNAARALELAEVLGYTPAAGKPGVEARLRAFRQADPGIDDRVRRLRESRKKKGDGP